MKNSLIKHNLIFILSIVFLAVLSSGCLDSNTVELTYYLNGANVYEVNATGAKMVIHNNPYAHDPTYQELINFILTDGTDRIPYNENSYVCIDYAVQLHDNAEKTNITGGVVCIEFYMGPGHACNVFNTTDKGFVYIDCVNSGTGTNNDKIVTRLNKNSLYHVSPITDMGAYYYVQEKDLIKEYRTFW